MKAIAYGSVVLLSGGMDSTTLATRLVRSGVPVVAVTFTYGSKHEGAEIGAAYKVANNLGIAVHRFVRLPSEIFAGGGSALIDEPLPLDRKLEEMQGVAPSYVPARNSVLLSIAASIADGLGFSRVYYAAHREDHVGYPDCRPEYFAAMRNALALGTKNEVELCAPFIELSKDVIVDLAYAAGAPLEMTHSCYQGHRPACGRCDTCAIRIDAFRRAGRIDPAPYAVEIDWQDASPWLS